MAIELMGSISTLLSSPWCGGLPVNAGMTLWLSPLPSDPHDPALSLLFLSRTGDVLAQCWVSMVADVSAQQVLLLFALSLGDPAYRCSENHLSQSWMSSVEHMDSLEVGVGSHLWNAQSLFQALCSGPTPGHAREMLSTVGDQCWGPHPAPPESNPGQDTDIHADPDPPGNLKVTLVPPTVPTL